MSAIVALIITTRLKCELMRLLLFKNWRKNMIIIYIYIYICKIACAYSIDRFQNNKSKKNLPMNDKNIVNSLWPIESVV